MYKIQPQATAWNVLDKIDGRTTNMEVHESTSILREEIFTYSLNVLDQKSE